MTTQGKDPGEKRMQRLPALLGIEKKWGETQNKVYTPVGVMYPKPFCGCSLTLDSEEQKSLKALVSKAEKDIRKATENPHDANDIIPADLKTMGKRATGILAFL